MAVISSASGNGKTTLGRELAQRLGVPFLELDSLVHGPNWAETPDDVLRARVEPVVASDGWVIDGTYQRKLGGLVLAAADLVVWLDLPLRVWIPRLARRTWRRLRGRETLWNDNQESIASAILGWNSLFGFALRTHFTRRRQWPRELAAYPVARLRRPDEVERSLGAVGSRPLGPVIVHITNRSAWTSACSLGRYEPASFDADGFIHFSDIDQFVAVANAAVAGEPDLVLVCVASHRLAAPLKYETSEPGGEQFPHLYGPLNLDAVVAVVPLVEGEDGFRVPAEVRAFAQ